MAVDVQFRNFIHLSCLDIGLCTQVRLYHLFGLAPDEGKSIGKKKKKKKKNH